MSERLGRLHFGLPVIGFTLTFDGTFTALGDFPEPVGPAFWNITS